MVAKTEALARAATLPVDAGIRLDRAAPVWALDGRLGQFRGCYVDEAGTAGDLLVNDALADRLGPVSIRASDEFAARRIQPRSHPRVVPRYEAVILRAEQALAVLDA